MKKFNKKIVSIRTYLHYYFGSFFGGINIILNKRHGVNDKFKERIMLACTEVTGCEFCSFAHGKEALEAGLSDEEISKILGGNSSDVPENEAVGIAYAIAFSDNDGRPGKNIYEKLVNEYGKKKAKTIRTLCNMISVGNTIGISSALLKNKFKRNKTEGSFFLREIIIFLLTLVFLPVSLTLFIIGIPFNI